MKSPMRFSDAHDGILLFDFLVKILKKRGAFLKTRGVFELRLFRKIKSAAQFFNGKS